MNDTIVYSVSCHILCIKTIHNVSRVWFKCRVLFLYINDYSLMSVYPERANDSNKHSSANSISCQCFQFPTALFSMLC